MKREELPSRTFIPTGIGDARENWYKTAKKPILDKIDPKITAPESFAIADAAAFISDVSKLVAGNGNLAVYFGAETPGKPDMILLFATVEKWSNLPEAYYRLNEKGGLEAIPVDRAHALRNNYQNGAQNLLDGSTDDGYPETEYVYFEQEVIAEILGECKRYVSNGKIDGLKIRLVAYADKNIESGFLERFRKKYLQRLTLLFTYLKDGRDTSFEEIDPERYEQTRAAQEGILSGGLNSGIPVPPPRPLPPPEGK